LSEARQADNAAHAVVAWIGLIAVVFVLVLWIVAVVRSNF